VKRRGRDRGVERMRKDEGEKLKERRGECEEAAVKRRREVESWRANTDVDICSMLGCPLPPLWL